jgi:hypothetical protein
VDTTPSISGDRRAVEVRSSSQSISRRKTPRRSTVR